jgi:hypothetical protein
MFTMDTDFLVEVARRQLAGEPFAAVIFAPQEGPSIGRLIDDLEYLARAALPTDMTNGLYYLPL